MKRFLDWWLDPEAWTLLTVAWLIAVLDDITWGSVAVAGIMLVASCIWRAVRDVR